MVNQINIKADVPTINIEYRNLIDYNTWSLIAEFDMKSRAPRNRTINLAAADRERLSKKIIKAPQRQLESVPQGTIMGNCLDIAKYLAKNFVDLMILDPPYNLDKNFNGRKFSRKPITEYTNWLLDVLSRLQPLLKPTASIYICGDWHTSASIYEAASQYFIVRNRITWEREKGRGATKNWKNSSEDVWFCTMSDNYKFYIDSVMLRRKVVAPYRDSDGKPKDWHETDNGNYRDTAPSNFWSDITIPFWSMPENTDHPTQKSEKLIAKLILASSAPGDLVFDPFLGSGTTSVVALKLGRKFLGIEIDEQYCLLAEKRLELALKNSTIQGFHDGIFWERNTLADQNKCLNRDPKSEGPKKNRISSIIALLF